MSKTTKKKTSDEEVTKEIIKKIALPESSLTDEETETLKKKARDILSLARRQILIKYPFIGNIALRMGLIPVRDVRVRTACTDGNNIFFDIAFLSSLNHDEQNFVLAHEVWHAVMMHMIRRGTRIPELFNIATDKEINYILKNDGFIPPENLCFPTDKEAGKSAEEIYEMMLKQSKKLSQQLKMKNAGGGSGGSSSNQSQSSKSGKGKNSKRSQGQRADGDEQDQENQQDGHSNGKLQGQFDKHVYDDQQSGNGQSDVDAQDGSNGEDGQSEATYGQISDKYGDVGFDKDYKVGVPRDFADKMRETIIAEAQRTEKMRGTVPGCIKELIKKITEPEVKWEEVLAQFVTKCYKSGNRSWIPPNRRHVHNGLYLQSRSGNKIKIAVGIDTSGSTMGDRGKFLGELTALVRSFGDFDLHLIECDAEVGSYNHYTQDDDLENIINNGEYEMTGGGGTAMMPIYDFIIDNELDVDCICIMTDGYIDNIPSSPVKIPTLWIITKDGTEDFCDWGQKIKLKHNDEDEAV